MQRFLAFGSIQASLLALALFLGMTFSGPAAAKRPDKNQPPPDPLGRNSLAEQVRGLEKLEGLFTFYRGGGKLYLQLPPDLVDEPLGFAAVRVGATGDFALRGETLDSQLVRWLRAGDQLVLRKENLEFRADPESDLAGAVAVSFPGSPVFTGRLVGLRDDPAPLLIDAASFFGPDIAEVFAEHSGFSVAAGDAAIESLKVFEDNVVARVRYVARRTSRGEGQGDEEDWQRFTRPGRLPDDRRVEVVVDYNFYRLPEDGFEPRFADERIGGFYDSFKDYTGMGGQDTLFRHLLQRWDVREPISFTMDRSVPEEWRALVREGAEWWNQAFAKIGVPDAVQILDPPDDPNWDPADIHNSVIYWNLADNLMFSGAASPTLIDPRNGKVLKAAVYLNGEFFSFALHRYQVYAWWRAPESGQFDDAMQARRAVPRALRTEDRRCDRAASFSSQLAFARLVLRSRGVLQSSPDEADRFAREAFLELVAHEVGHALGFPHNWKASLISDWEDVRDGMTSGRMDKNIFSASVMDYDPIYLAPKGEPQGDYFMRGIGPYDELAVDYLYRPLEGMSWDLRYKVLDGIAAQAEIGRGLIYDNGTLNDIDPTTNSDDLGDDPLAFAESRLQMIHEEVLPVLPALVLGEGHDFNLLRQALDAAVFSVAMDYIDLTARHVGGQILMRRVASSASSPEGGPPPIEPVDPEIQRRALEVLEQQVFAPGAFDLTPGAMEQLKADLLYDWNYPWRYASDYNLITRIQGLYDTALSVLLDPARLARVLDNERRHSTGEPFTIPELLSRLEDIAFDNLSRPIPADRRALQRTYFSHLQKLVISPDRGTPAEATQLAAATLRSIQQGCDRAVRNTRSLDAYTRAHLQDLSNRAEKTLDADIEASGLR